MAASEKEKMLAGEAYWAADTELVADRRRCRALLRAYNDERDENELPRLLTGLLRAVGDNVFIERPFTCDYGYNIVVGADSFINYGAVMLDVVGVEIGAHVKIGPLVQFLAADHPVDPVLRRADVESGRPIAVGDNVWIGGGAILCPGVTLGVDSVIGAGSVVTRDIPAGVVAAGVPCRVIREL